MKKSLWVAMGLLISGAIILEGQEQKSTYNGLNLSMGNLSRLSRAKTRSISPENFTGEKGKGGMSTDGPALKAARDLGQGWKVSPYVRIQPKQTFTLAEIQGPGAIQHIWMTPTGHFRYSILRIYWDGKEITYGSFHRRRRFAIPVDAQYGIAEMAGGSHPDVLDGPGALNLRHRESLFGFDAHVGRNLPALAEVACGPHRRTVSGHAAFALFAGKILRADRARLGAREARQVSHAQIQPVVIRLLLLRLQQQRAGD